MVIINMKPKDLFDEFNMYPEQLKRVSCMQYTYHNYNRFLGEEESLHHENETGLFNIGNRNESTITLYKNDLML